MTVATADQAAKPTPAPMKATQAQPIPFRESSPTSAPEVFGLFATTVLLLAAFYAIAWFARRAGWLDRWVGPRPPAGENPRQLALLERLPVSRRTTLYRVRHGDKEYLLAESSTPVQLSAVSELQP
jgi:hypothetical protein